MATVVSHGAGFAALLVTLSAGCAVHRPALDDLLGAGRTEAERATVGARIVAAIAAADVRAGECRMAAANRPTDPAAQLAAAKALFVAAELRTECALRTVLAASPPNDVDALLELEGDGPAQPWQGEVLALATAGIAHAESAVADRELAAGAQHYLALHLALTARAQGVARSLLAGLGPRLAAATRAAMAADPSFENGAPLVLRGRFLAQAPWPYGDSAAALELLERAFDLGPTVPGAQFYGDELWRLGRFAAARTAWRAAAAVDTDDPLAPFQLERMALRLRLGADVQGGVIEDRR